MATSITIKSINNMKKISLTIALLVLALTDTYAQMTADDAKGQSTIVYKSTSIALNITDATVSANWNNFNRLGIDKKSRLLWGLSASSKNKDGLSDLFESGDFTPESKFGGFIGMRFNGDASSFDLNTERERLEMLPIYRRYIKTTSYKDMVEKIIKDRGLSASELKKLTDVFNPLTNNYMATVKDLIAKIDGAKFDASGQPTVKIIRDSLAFRQAQINSMQSAFDKVSNAETAIITELAKHRNITTTKAYTVFLNGGFNGNSLNFYDPTVTTSYAARFDTVSFRGGFIDLGFNYDTGPHWTLGVSVGYEHYNNIDSLSKTDYSVKTSTSQGNDQLSTSKSYSAYSGHYIVYDRANIKTDALCFEKVSDDYRLVWNTLYSRFILPIKDSRIKPVINLGSSINFYKVAGKIVGGFYLQSNDVFNKMESKDNFGDRLSFGITAKYSFDSIVDRSFSH